MLIKWDQAHCSRVLKENSESALLSIQNVNVSTLQGSLCAFV